MMDMQKLIDQMAQLTMGRRCEMCDALLCHNGIVVQDHYFVAFKSGNHFSICANHGDPVPNNESDAHMIRRDPNLGRGKD